MTGLQKGPEKWPKAGREEMGSSVSMWDVSQAGQTLCIGLELEKYFPSFRLKGDVGCESCLEYIQYGYLFFHT